MQHHVHNGQTPAHGFKVGIGTMAVTALYEYLLDQKLEDIRVDDCCARWPDNAAREASVRALFDQADLLRVALQESQAKWVETTDAAAAVGFAAEGLAGMRECLLQQLIPLQELKGMLRAVGAPVEPEEIGISRARLRESFRQSYYLRRRFTALDLAARCGLLEPGLAHLFGPEGPWPLAGR